MTPGGPCATPRAFQLAPTRHVVTCSCGWQGARHGTAGEARAEWAKHREQADADREAQRLAIRRIAFASVPGWREATA